MAKIYEIDSSKPDIIKITSKSTKEEIKKFLKTIRTMQLESEQTEVETIYYCPLRVTYVLTNKICIANLLTHPLVLLSKKFYEDCKEYNNNEIFELLKNVITYEVTENDKRQILTQDELQKVIKFFRKLEKEIFKVNKK